MPANQPKGNGAGSQIVAASRLAATTTGDLFAAGAIHGTAMYQDFGAAGLSACGGEDEAALSASGREERRNGLVAVARAVDFVAEQSSEVADFRKDSAWPLDVETEAPLGFWSSKENKSGFTLVDEVDWLRERKLWNVSSRLCI